MVKVTERWISIEDAKSDSEYPMYNPQGKLLAWLKQVFNYRPTKYVVRSKQRDPHNWGNPEGRLYDKEVFVCNTKDELISTLLLSLNHMSTNVMYLTKPNGDVVYSNKIASGGFSVQKMIQGESE